MRNAETILDIIRQRGQYRLPVKDAYRLLFQRDLYLRAYGKLYRNDGAMTPGATSETVDGMSLEKIDTIIDVLRHERYRWTPVRRTYIPKKNGKRRPLGLPSWSDKLLQEGLVASFVNPCKSLKEKEKIDGLAVCVSGADGPNTMAIRRIPGLHCATKCSAFF